METLQIEALKTTSLTVQEKANSLAVRTPEEYQKAGEFLVAIKGRKREVEEFFAPAIEAAFAAHKATVAQKKAVLEPLEKAEGILSPKIRAYLQEEERSRREAEAKAQEVIRKQQEAARLASAVRLEQSGRSAEAERALAEPIHTPTVVLPKAVPKVEGLRARSVWKFRIVDATLIPANFLIPDEVKLGQVVRAMKGTTQIPGVEVYEDTAL